MRSLNEELQMRSDWHLPICTGKERLKENGQKAHPTQKPEALIYRVLLASSNPGDVVLDPFFGTGTTGAVARRLHRHWIGIEKNPHYVKLARQRIAQVAQLEFDPPIYVQPNPRHQKRIPFGALLENGLLEPGQLLFFGEAGEITARVVADGSITFNGTRGSIHQVARQIRQGPVNGWDVWFYLDGETGQRQSIDQLRQQLHNSVLPVEEKQPVET
jgi:modification methylase